MENSLPAIPAKRYFTIGEVSELCGVKPYVLRYWEQEFTQLKPMKRRGNRRYYQHHEVLLIRRIRDLLYDQGFTISGARNQLGELAAAARAVGVTGLPPSLDDIDGPDDGAVLGVDGLPAGADVHAFADEAMPLPEVRELAPSQLRAELMSIRALLAV
ncbi:MerR family transcriptional regulator [Aquabacterium sp. OR-4]|uniref:MerR family transcriptional regulator n=1 Tax=Aquabacterium sp. OR-4 TaxID=2978127 RepID=UPI0021B31DDB|nr:MerR family transcriptional regulator [Aquabacterium sp. OR-4]MDT7835266.1 MerR family transcriptional regulator [Aquabacterium sp. OR-4]